MSGLVTMIVLVYLLVIAVAVALWAAASLRRVRAPEHAQRAPAATAEADGQHIQPSSHDLYRGARARKRSAAASVADPFLADEPAASPAASVGLPAKAAAPQRQETGGSGPRADGIRVLESRLERKRKAESRPEERAPKDDAFERFLRANEELER